MKRIKYILLLFVAFIFFSTQFADAQIVVRVKPRPPKVLVVKSDTQLRGHAWRVGHWKIYKNKYVWVKGQWVKSRKNNVWIKGYWKHMRMGWVWVPGRWARENAFFSQR